MSEILYGLSNRKTEMDQKVNRVVFYMNSQL